MMRKDMFSCRDAYDAFLRYAATLWRHAVFMLLIAILQRC